MGDLKPIGSEKLQGTDKINRILELAKYKEHLPKSVNENKSVEYSIKLVDGENYHIIKEKNGYVIKKGINESVSDYIEPMKNRKYYSSYSQAFKRLNLIAKEVNLNEGHEKNVSLFAESEKDEKRFFLKTSTMEQAPAPAPVPAPSPEAAPPMTPSDESVPSSEPSPDEEIPVDIDTDTETDIQLDKEETPEMVTFKTIQKLTGKLAQKIREFSESEEEPMTSKDIKYVVNSILSALNLDLLDDEDKEEIMTKFEGEEFDETGMESEPDMEGVEDIEIEAPAEPEMAESSHRPKIKHQSYTDKEASKVEEMIESLFSESKVDKILNKYFTPADSEKKIISERIEKENKTIKKINLISETKEQKNAAINLISRHPKINLIGKTKNDTLVFEHNSKKIGVTKSGKLL